MTVSRHSVISGKKKRIVELLAPSYRFLIKVGSVVVNFMPAMYAPIFFWPSPVDQLAQCKPP